MNSFEYGFFDELEKIAMRSAVDPSFAEMAARYDKHPHLLNSAASDPDRSITEGVGKMSSRDVGDLYHRTNQMLARGGRAASMLPQAVSDIGDISRKHYNFAQRREQGLPAYGLSAAEPNTTPGRG